MKEMYVALSGAVAREQQMTLVANNLANINTPGFKKEQAVFQQRSPEVNFDKMLQSHDPALRLPYPAAAVQGDRTHVVLSQSWTDFSAGSVHATGNPLDMSLETRGTGQGTPFFVVSTPEGERLTRMGNFKVNAARELVTADGARVMSQSGGPLVLSGNVTEPVVVSDQGEIFAAGNRLGAVRVVMVENPQALDKAPNGYFTQREDGTPSIRPVTAADGVLVHNRTLEMANVNAVEELVRMIDLQRNYGAFQKAIQTLDDESSKMISMASTSR